MNLGDAAMPIDELAQRVLATLEEAGEENIPTLMNAVLDVSGGEADILALKKALHGLLDEGFVSWATAPVPGERLKGLENQDLNSEVYNISNWLQYDATRAVWIDSRVSGPPFLDNYPYILLTQLGRLKSWEILASRGYQWWRPRPR